MGRWTGGVNWTTSLGKINGKWVTVSLIRPHSPHTDFLSRPPSRTFFYWFNFVSFSITKFRSFTTVGGPLGEFLTSRWFTKFVNEVPYRARKELPSWTRPSSRVTWVAHYGCWDIDYVSKRQRKKSRPDVVTSLTEYFPSDTDL